MVLRFLLVLSMSTYISAQGILLPGDDLYLGSRCLTPQGSLGTCVVLKKCTALTQKLRAREIMYNSNQIKHCGFDKAEPIVCCEEPPKTEPGGENGRQDKSLSHIDLYQLLKERRTTSPPTRKSTVYTITPNDGNMRRDRILFPDEITPVLPEIITLRPVEDYDRKHSEESGYERIVGESPRPFVGTSLDSKGSSFGNSPFVTPSNPTPPSVPAIRTEPISNPSQQNDSSESNAWIINSLLKSPYLSPEEINNINGLKETFQRLDTVSTTTQATTQSTTKTVDTRRPAEIACDKFNEQTLKPLSFHIISGIPAKPGEFPHMAAIALPAAVGGTNYSFQCGASLISENYALTAAHCVNRPELRPLFLRLGKISLFPELDDQLDATDVGVEEIFLHPDYRGSLVYNDIALLKLNRSLEFDPYLRPVCLYTKSDPLADGTILAVTGWGQPTFNVRSMSSVLLKANLTHVNVNECNRTYINSGPLERRMRLGVRSDTQLCAVGRNNEDACQGDSGGPLQLVLEEGSSIQVGVVSIGIGCGFMPGVYTKVVNYLDWIESIVWPS